MRKKITTGKGSATCDASTPAAPGVNSSLLVVARKVDIMLPGKEGIQTPMARGRSIQSSR